MCRVTNISLGGSPGLVVMGVDSCSKGCGFESHHHTLDGHFFTFFFYNCIWTSIITFRFYETEICLLRVNAC